MFVDYTYTSSQRLFGTSLPYHVEDILEKTSETLFR